MTFLPLYERRLSPAAGMAILAVIALGGLFYVKWLPYYHKALVASASHSIGRSILMGTAAQAPPPSWQAALDYSLAYGRAIWQAMVLGLLLGAALQEFAPISGDDVHVLCRAGGHWAAPPQRLGRRRHRILARQHHTQSGDAGVHGVCPGMEVGGAASNCWWV